MRRKIKTVMEQMNAEKPDDVLADLESKHGCAAPNGSASGAESEWTIVMTEQHTTTVMASSRKEALWRAAEQGYAGDHKLISITAKRSRM